VGVWVSGCMGECVVGWVSGWDCECEEVSDPLTQSLSAGVIRVNEGLGSVTK